MAADRSCTEDVQTILGQCSGLIEANDVELSSNINSVVQQLACCKIRDRGKRLTFED